MVNSDELIGATESLMLQARYHIKQHCYNRVLLYLYRHSQTLNYTGLFYASLL
jgi:hypothetical protein